MSESFYSPIRLCLRGPYFLVERAGANAYEKLLGAPARGCGASPATKTIEAAVTLTKKSCKKAAGFPVKNFGAWTGSKKHF